MGDWGFERLSGAQLAFNNHSLESSWREYSFGINVLLESSSSAEAALSDVQAQAQAQRAALEAELFSRIRNLEAQLVHGLPPQLNSGDYERLVQEHLTNSVSIAHYWNSLCSGTNYSSSKYRSSKPAYKKGFFRRCWPNPDWT